MTNLKLIKEPGYIYDLFYIFSLNYNLDYHLANDLIFSKPEADTEFFNKIIQNFSPFFDDLLLFFRLKKNGRGFMSSCYFTPYENVFTTDYCFEFLQNELSNHDLFIEKLIDFYFPDMSHEEILKYKNSIVELGKLINSSDYEDLIKYKLYSFFINPEPIILKLIYELISKKTLLSGYYEKNYSKIIEIQNVLNFDSLKENLSSFRDIEFLNKENINIYISICLVNKNCFNLIHGKDTTIIILGNDYKEALIYYNSQKNLPRLKDLGDIITEQNRIDILDLMLEHGEVTNKDLERLLNFSGSTAYYHLTMMMRFRIIKSRNQGRTILYSINEKYFKSLIEILSKYYMKG